MPYVLCDCLTLISSSQGFSMDAGIMFVAPAVAFDTVAVGLLILGLYYQSSGASRKHMQLMRLIIQDGLLYFAVVFVSNIAWILVHIFESNKLVSYFAIDILISRAPLIANLNFTVHGPRFICTVGDVSCLLCHMY